MATPSAEDKNTPADDSVTPPTVATATEGTDSNASGAPAEGVAPAEQIDEQEQKELAEEMIEQKPDETIALARTQFSLPEAWTDDDVLAWVASVAALPVGTAYSEQGVFFNDPTRAKRFSDLSSWSTEELELAVKGALNDVIENKLSAVIKELRQRTTTIDQAWSFQQVLDFYRQNLTPAKTSNGVWVTDVTRGDKPASSWTTAELEAWALGEIKSTNKATEGKLAVELKTRLVLVSKSNAPADVIAAYKVATSSAAKTTDPTEVVTQAAPTNTTTIVPVKGLTLMNQSFIDSVLERYAATVAIGKPVTEADGGKITTQLENMFQYVIALEPEGMVAGLERIKAEFIKGKDGLYSTSNAHRFDHMLRSQDNFKTRHTNFVEAMIIYANPNKEVRKQCDLRMLLAKQPPAKIESLVEYFTKIA